MTTRTLCLVALGCALMTLLGCQPEKRVEVEWPDLNDDIEPDADVKAPAWYKPKPEYSPWPLGPEPEYATAEWRHWCTLRYGAREVIRPMASPPNIDGKLDDPAWQGKAVHGAFVDPTGRPAAPKTTIYLGYDANNLYVAGQLEEPYLTKRRAEGKLRDGPIRTDDHLDIRLAPDWRSPGSPTYWFLVNSKGQVADGLDSSIAWSPDVKAAANDDPKAWTFELAVPLKAFRPSSPDPWGEVWACCLVRHRYAGGERQLSAWTPLRDVAQGSSQWGYLIVKGVKPPPKPPEPKKPETDDKKKAGGPEKTSNKPPE